ncbi:hypothetical protein AVEN_150083-1 [Araneus ventricosus]|uniref:Uncharacterized protein n=1 Tax=Araneus ventricosus TaxID=182803 RepID=A0A4Y2DGT2_ARAVE|nr:hypothetical protein AVEN_150083-1 [Araneus ventricosus]
MSSRWCGATQPAPTQLTLLGLGHKRAGGEANRPAAAGGRKPHSHLLVLVWRGSLEKGCNLRCRPRHLIAVQNYKIALVLLQNRTLI